MTLIPTQYKIRLSREFSYPVGAEILSESLAGVPQFSDLSIRFSDRPTAWASKFQRTIAEEADYKIITAGGLPPELFVYPVLRRLKHAAHEALLARGLPLLREWLINHHPPDPLKFTSCEIVFSPSALDVYLRDLIAGREYTHAP